MFRGINTPLITIFDDSGKIDFKAMEIQVDRLVKARVNGILLFGSMGEFYAVDEESKRELIKKIKGQVKDKAKIIVGIGDTNEDNVLRLGHYCEEVGVDAVNVISPYYFGPGEDAVYKYFSDIAKSLELPIMLYNFRERTGSDLSPETICKLAVEYKNIVAVKDTVDNISHTRKICQLVKPIRADFDVLSGFDEYYLVNRVSGGDGVLCGLTNVVPELFVDMHNAYENGAFNQAIKLAECVSKLMKLYDVTNLFVVGMKEAVRLMGVPMSTYTKAPGMQITEKEKERVKSILIENNIL